MGTKKLIYLLLALVMLCTTAGQAQSKWHRTEAEVTIAPTIFHSTNIIGLPTSNGLGQGRFEFEISHRFLPTLKDGYEDLFGFDGPVRMRIALGYAVTNRLMVTLGRSNIDDNVDLWFKYQLLQATGKGSTPIKAAFRIGGAFNPVETFRFDELGNTFTRAKKHKRHYQYYGQLIIDFKPLSRLAVGLIPSYLYNRDIRTKDIDNSFVLGTHSQLFLSNLWSVVGEWSIILTDKDGWHNPGAVGLELETGAHIFELFVTNQVRMNPAQYLAGSSDPFGTDNLRLGFMINRIL